MRWWSELRRPALKCERLEHEMRTVERRVLLYPSTGYRGVADRAIEELERCSRCGHETEPTIMSRSALTGLTMPSDRWDVLQREGRLVR